MLPSGVPVFISAQGFDIVASVVRNRRDLLGPFGVYPRGNFETHGGEDYVLTVGRGHAQGPGVVAKDKFNVALGRDGFTLWKRG